METETAVAKCFSSLLHHGLEEEHNFAASLIDSLLNYLNSKIMLYPKHGDISQEETHKSDLHHMLAVEEEGEIVTFMTPAKVGENEDFVKTDTIHVANADTAEAYREVIGINDVEKPTIIKD